MWRRLRSAWIPPAILLAAYVSLPAFQVRQNAGHPAAEARLRGQRFERAIGAMRRVLQVWLTHADQRTLLLPDRVPGPGGGLAPGDNSRLYSAPATHATATP